MLSRIALLVALIACSTNAVRMQINRLDLTRYPDATCNDGSPAAYYFRQSNASVGSAAYSTFIVHQEGGAWCHTAETCRARPQNMRSSTGYAAEIEQHGIFQSRNPVLRDANLVFIPYCTSDAYMGNQRNTSFGFAFMGRHVVEGIFSELMRRHRLASLTNVKLLYGGCSAGGRGALFNFEFVHALVRRFASSPSTFKMYGVFDSPLWIDMPPFNPSLESLAQQTQAVFNLVNAVTTVDRMCLSSQLSTTRWHCLFPQYAIEFVRSAPYVMLAFLNDAWQLPTNGISNPPTQAQLTFVETFRKNTELLATEVYHNAPAKSRGIFPACYRHCNTMEPRFSTLTVNGITLEDELTTLLNATNAATSINKDTCQGFACGPGCNIL